MKSTSAELLTSATKGRRNIAIHPTYIKPQYQILKLDCEKLADC